MRIEAPPATVSKWCVALFLAARVTCYRNRLEGRIGTLWEGRYKSSPVHTDHYLLACCRYIELNPVRSGMTRDLADYPWSSLRQRMGWNPEDWIGVVLVISFCA